MKRDRIDWYRRNQREDIAVNANNAHKGETFAEFLEISLNRVAESLPQRTVFLALGCGAAIAEREMANRCSAVSIDFVDKNDVSKLVKPASKRREKFLQQDMVDFLKSAPRRKYHVISLVGVEYLIDNTEFFKAILPDLSRVLKKGGVVFVYPTFSTDQNIDFSVYGFENISFHPQAFFVLRKIRR